VQLSREVIAMIPEFIERTNVLGIGEIGLNKNTRNESIVFLEHLQLAAKLGGEIDFAGDSQPARIASGSDALQPKSGVRLRRV
jgi:hypothetical protein